MSKSNAMRRWSYCTASTSRTWTSMPARARLLAKASASRSSSRLVTMISKRKGRPPLRARKVVALQFVAGGVEQAERFAQIVAVAAGAIACRRRPGAVEHVGAHRVRKGRQQRALVLVRRAVVSRQFRVVEIARAAPVQIEKEIVIDPRGVEQHRDAPARTRRSAKMARRVLKTKLEAGLGRPLVNASFTMRPSRTAGKS